MSTGNGVGLVAGEVEASIGLGAVTPVTEAPKSAVKATKAPKTKPPVKQTVNILLDANVYKHFADAAATDERTLSMYLARVIKKVYEQEQAPATV